jgi:tRNA-splicing ligase RtcB
MKEKLEKSDVNEWLIPKNVREGMNVDAKIIANDAVFNEIESSAIEQLTNVACLPGVLEPVLGLPDMHWGYGLPMGAVSAFDMEDGIISAGMVGFDINCLAGDTKVLHEFGYHKPIKEFAYSWPKDSIKCMNPTKKVKNTRINLFLKQRPKARVFEVKTLSGNKIIASEDHPFFTEKGMIPLKDIKDEKISTFPFEGVGYEKPSDDVILSEDDFKGKDQQIINGLVKRDLLPLKYSSRKLPYIIKLLGFIWGDGCAYKVKHRGCLCAYSKDKDELEAVANDIKNLGYSPLIHSRDRHHKIDTTYGKVEFDARAHELRCGSNALFSLMKKLGLPIGDKTETEFEIPLWLLKAPLWQKRLFLAGLFGAELSSPLTVTNHGYNFNSPVFSLNKTLELTLNAEDFLEQIKAMLNELGVKSNILNIRCDYKGKKGIKYRLRLQISSKPENLIQLWKTVGYEYSKKKSFLGNAAVRFLETKKQILSERKRAINRAEKLRKKGVRPVDIYKQLQSAYVNKRFLQRTIYEGRTDVPRISFSFHKFDEYVKTYTSGLGETGQVWDTIVDKKEIPYSDYIYDFNVHSEHHNFIANNFVVSNCGINMIRTNIPADEMQAKLKELIPALFDKIPCGVGSKGKLKLDKDELNDVLVRGVEWAVENGYGVKEDLERTEENGRMEGADPSKVSDLAKKKRRSTTRNTWGRKPLS